MDHVEIFEEPHHLALERSAAKALSEKNDELAFRLSDRRCRLDIPPLSHSFLLRAEANHRLGRMSDALADVEAALEVSPEDIQVNRRMMIWGEGQKQMAAARTLLSLDRDIHVQRRAMQLLVRDGATSHAAIRAYDETLEGLVVWDSIEPCEISIVSGDDNVTYFLEPDPTHDLSGSKLSVAGFSLPRPRSAAPQLISIVAGGRRLHSQRVQADDRPVRQIPVSQVCSDLRSAAITIIVPIYEDFAATRACLESLFDAVTALEHCRLLLVDDATPNDRIAGFLAELSSPRIRVLTNSQNLGFVGSINKALGMVTDGDVILLNSDTIVPPGFVERLAATAHSAPDIGTVTPLSNNGEFASFPIPNNSNMSGSLEDVIRLDRLASDVNSGGVVDIPSGIGFCLYVKRACLEAVGSLSETFQRGYLEDVDFCLRARQRGFRNVCATSIFVGHEGSRSFKTEKRALVVRNLGVLDIRFPSYREECSAFIASDPLREPRERIERNLTAPDGHPRLIVYGRKEIGVISRARALRLRDEMQPAMLLEVSGAAARPIGLGEAPPQNIAFRLSDPSDIASLRSYLGELAPSCIEIWDAAAIPDSLMDLLTVSAIPYELYLADAGPFFPDGWSFFEVIAAEQKRSRRPSRSVDPNLLAWRKRWHDIAKSAQAVVTPSGMAKALARRYWKDIDIAEFKPARGSGRPPKKNLIKQRHFAFLPLRYSSEEFSLMRALVGELRKRHPGLSISVVGRTVDDRVLMQAHNCFVTGTVEPDDVGRVLDQYAVDHLLVGPGRPLFGHPSEEAAIRSHIPIARFDWSFGESRQQGMDLAIDPRLAFDRVAELLLSWMGAAESP